MSAILEHADTMIALSKRYYALRAHPMQLAYSTSKHRFNVLPAGRRSGKTERFKRKLVRRALQVDRLRHDETPRFFAGAPTRDQAKRIYWADLKAMTKPYWSKTPSESELIIWLITGSEIHVLGMDKPERIEGSPWDGGGLDEYANMKEKAWGENVFPALADRNGWCDLLGVPEGRNHYFDIFEAAKAEMLEKGAASDFGAFTWKSADILPPAQIELARRSLDPLTFEQEYEASFVNFSGRAYYAFNDANKLPVRKLYDKLATLHISLDFNVEPGVATISQEMVLRTLGVTATCVIGQVHIPVNSNTLAVCRRILADWGSHEGRIELYGDATGGARGTAKVLGSDWDLAKQYLKHGIDELPGFGHRVSFHVKESNPYERARVNAVNTRCCTSEGVRRLFVDPVHAPHVVKDLEGVSLLIGGSGEIDKKKDPKLTHISDALGYYLDYRFPVARAGVSFDSLAA